MSVEMTIGAIRARWENGYQIRDAGGWVKVAGQPDPRQDIRALLSMKDSRPAVAASSSEAPKPKKKRSAKKKSSSK